MKNIKKFMKARAWVLTLLVCMIGLVGFGQTTSDLTQNSETKAITGDNSVVELVSVVNQSPVLVNVFIYESDGYQMEVKRFKDDKCEYLQFGEARTNIVDIVDDVGWQKDKQIRSKQNIKANITYQFINRRARDGLMC